MNLATMKLPMTEKYNLKGKVKRHIFMNVDSIGDKKEQSVNCFSKIW